MSSNPSIVLLTPNWRWDRSPLPVDTLLPPPAPPLEWAYLSAQAPCGDVAIVDSYVNDQSIDQLKTVISNLQPQYIVVATTPSLLYWRCPPMTINAVALAVQAIRTVANPKIILVGPHPTHSPVWSLKTSGADFAFRGTPERSLIPQLLLNRLDNCAYIYSAARSGPISVLSGSDILSGSFAGFDWGLPYKPHMWNVTADEKARLSINGKSALIEASRGCPWNCTYCAKAPTRDVYLRRPLAAIKSELAELKGIGVDYVYFIDETFNIGGQHQESLLDLIKRSGMRFGFQGRADLVTAETAQRLAESGCVYAELGIDVASTVLSKQIDRRQNTERAIVGVEAAKDHIPITRFNRINLSTRDYTAKLGLATDTTWEYPPDPAYPYPGAPLGHLVMKLYGRSEFDWLFAEKYSWWLRFEVYLQRQCPDLPVDEVDRLQREFLDLSGEAVSALASFMTPVVSNEQFLVANKYVGGLGRDIRIRSTR